jgi:hypothetical protein
MNFDQWKFTMPNRASICARTMLIICASSFSTCIFRKSGNLLVQETSLQIYETNVQKNILHNNFRWGPKFEHVENFAFVKYSGTASIISFKNNPFVSLFAGCLGENGHICFCVPCCNDRIDCRIANKWET